MSTVTRKQTRNTTGGESAVDILVRFFFHHLVFPGYYYVRIRSLWNENSQEEKLGRVP